jgi:hypothetical protein
MCYTDMTHTVLNFLNKVASLAASIARVLTAILGISGSGSDDPDGQ